MKEKNSANIKLEEARNFPKDKSMSLNVCIFGVSGYTGAKLLFFLNKHPKVNVHGVFGNLNLGKKIKEINPNLNSISELTITDYQNFNFKETDLIFSCLPHGKFQQDIIRKLDLKIPIIDLSGDFRLESISQYERFYSTKHKSKNLKEKFIYGLSEIYRKEIKKSKFISNPGCYPTSILLPMIPLLKKKELKIENIIIDSKSGVTGAGKNPKTQNLFSELSGNFFSYGIDSHKHYPEIKQELKKLDKKISFTFIPHLLPVKTGIQSTIYINKTCDENHYHQILSNFYQNEPFINIYSGSQVPSLKDVQGTNNIAIKIFTDFSKERIVIISCIDNLIKGASGQAIQNMNIMFDFDETESLI